MQLVAAEAAPLEVRQAASVSFKNHVKVHWAGRPAGELGDAEIPATPEPEKVLRKAGKYGYTFRCLTGTAT